jgi:hypothetical protein
MYVTHSDTDLRQAQHLWSTSQQEQPVVTGYMWTSDVESISSAVGFLRMAC